MSSKDYFWETLEGTNVNDILFAFFSSVDALHEVKKASVDQVYTWNRKIAAKNGDDIIVRDRPGDYKADAAVGLEAPYVTKPSIETGGHALVDGGAGTDTVSYGYFDGGLEIDLHPMGQVVEQTFTLDIARYFDPETKGFAKLLGTSAQTIHGMDFLSGVENVIGTGSGDHITGSDGSNSLKGGGGRDTLYGGNGADSLDGGAGNDKIHGDDGDDVLNGRAGNDSIWGGNQNDVINGGTGHDYVFADTGIDIVNGEAGNDTIHGGDNGDVIMAGTGHDIVNGDEGDDEIWGQAHNDSLNGGLGDDTIRGGDGDDTINGNQGYDHIDAGAGDDAIFVGDSNAVIDGGSGFDVVTVVSAEQRVHVELGSHGNGFAAQLDGLEKWHTDLEGIEALVMSDQSDRVTINGFVPADNEVWGRKGTDKMWLGKGADTAWGGEGSDVLYGEGGPDYIDGQSGGDHIYGGNGGDALFGSSGNDELFGHAGNDELSGGTGLDTLCGGPGADTLTGGNGQDTFRWLTGDFGLDTITDFTLGIDLLDIDALLASPPVALWDDYVGKVLALPTAHANTTGLYAMTETGLSAFAWIEGHDAETMTDAIASGILFGIDSESRGLDGLFF